MLTPFQAVKRKILFSTGVAAVFSLIAALSSVLAYYIQSLFLVILCYLLIRKFYPVSSPEDALRALLISDADKEAEAPVPGHEPSVSGEDKKKRYKRPKLKEPIPVFLPAILGEDSAVMAALKSPPIAFAVTSISALCLTLVLRHFVFSQALFHRSVVLLVFVSIDIFILTGEAARRITEMDIGDFPKKSAEKFYIRFAKAFSTGRGYYFLGEMRGHKIGLPRWMRWLHILIVGPTGAQKSTSFIIPQLLFDAEAPGSAVVPDAKSPDLFNAVAGRWLKFGKKAYLFDCWHDDCVGLNPLIGADDMDLLTITTVLLQEDMDARKEEVFWQSRTRYLLYAILRLVQTWQAEYANLPSVYYLVQSVDTLDQFVKILPQPLSLLFSDYNKKFKPTDRLNALTSIRQKLEPFMDPAVRKAFSRADFRLDMLFSGKDPCLFVLGAPIDHKNAAMKINSLMVNLIVNMAFRERRIYKQLLHSGHKALVPSDLYLYLDELRSLRVNDLPNLVSIARETRTNIIVSITDLPFLKTYKHDESSLHANLRTQLFFHGLDPVSCKYVSDSLGEKDKNSYSVMRDEPVVREDKEKLMTPADVKNMPEDEVIVMNPVTAPFPAKRVSMNDTPWLQRMTVPAPASMKDLYAEWGLCIEPLKDPVLPKVDSLHYNLAALKKGRHPADVRYEGGETENFRERGGGRVTVHGDYGSSEEHEPEKKYDDTAEQGGMAY